jgi:hypothetical protein
LVLSQEELTVCVLVLCGQEIAGCQVHEWCLKWRWKGVQIKG